MTEMQLAPPERFLSNSRSAGQLTATRPNQLKAPQLVAIAVCLIVSSIPIIRLLYYIWNTGCDLPTNDDIGFIELNELMASTKYNWLGFARDSFNNGHCLMVPMFLFYCLGALTGWNQYIWCTIGVALCLLRLAFSHNFLFSRSATYIKYMGWAMLSWLFFAPSQISVYTSGSTAIAWQLCLLLVSIAFWFCKSYASSILGAIGAGVSGTLACWTLAAGLPAWPLLFASLFIFGYRKRSHYLLLGALCALSLIPYLLVNLSTHHHPSLGFHWLTFVNLIGRPFCDKIGILYLSMPDSQAAGLMGLAYLVMAVCLSETVRKGRQELASNWLFCGYGLLATLTVSAARIIIAPWYCMVSTWFWAGLAALYLQLLTAPKIVGFKSAKAIPVIVLATICYWSLRYSRYFDDKQFYLQNRSPACGSLIRNYRIAPDTRRDLIFRIPELTFARLARPLKEHHWSVFGDHQEWLLQGDCVLPLVQSSAHSTRWIRGHNLKEGRDFTDFRWLNLDLAGAETVTWHVDLPQSLRRAAFYSALYSPNAGSIRLAVRLTGQKDDLRSTVITTSNRKTSPITIDLTDCQGKSVDFIISGLGQQADQLVLENPRIVLDIDRIEERTTATP